MYYLLDNELNFITPIEGYKSMIWVTRYYEPGDFELQIAANEKWLSLFKRHFYIVRDDDNYEQAMIIENIQLTTDVEEGNYLLITGRDLKSILSRREYVYSVSVENYVSELKIRGILEKNIINPKHEKRKIDNFILGELKNYEETYDPGLFRESRVLDTVVNLCKLSKFGFDVKLNLKDKQFIFDLFKGVDRSQLQRENQSVIFSPEYENLLNSTLKFNDTNTYTGVIMDGPYNSKYDYNMVIGASGLELNEKYFDASDYYAPDGWDLVDYTDIFKGYIQAEFAKLKQTVTKTMEVEIETNHTWTYRKDYFVGDIVECINEYNMHTQPKIIEVIESENSGGREIVITLEDEELEANLFGESLLETIETKGTENDEASEIDKITSDNSTETEV